MTETERTMCEVCGQPMFLHGISGNRPLFACRCGIDLVGNSSYNGCVAWTLDPDNPDYDEKPELRFITGEDLAWGNWMLAIQETRDLVKTYPEHRGRFEDILE